MGWCEQTPATERRALPWSSFQFPTERNGRRGGGGGGGGGVAYNKKSLETPNSPPLQHPNAPSPLAHDPCSSPGHMHSYEGGRNAKAQTGSDRETDREHNLVWRRNRNSFLLYSERHMSLKMNNLVSLPPQVFWNFFIYVAR